MIGLYVAGTSPLHRIPAGVKLLLLAVATMAMLWSGRAIVAGLALVVLSYAIARIPWRTALAQLVPVLWFAIPLFLLQWWTLGAGRAAVIVGQLVAVFWFATLLTLTTRVSEMLGVFERMLRPLRIVGVDPARAGLLLALAIRCVPLVAQTYQEVRDARRARGLEWSPSALAVPLIVRLLRRADEIGEALAARGVDD